jgi:hypothetical protein
MRFVAANQAHHACTIGIGIFPLDDGMVRRLLEDLLRRAVHTFDIFARQARPGQTEQL